MANIEGQIVSDGEVQVVAFKLRNEEFIKNNNRKILRDKIGGEWYGRKSNKYY